MAKPLIDINFIPICPLCDEPMPVIKGQKNGAWYCLKCGSQFWDEIEAVMLGEPDQTDQMGQKILCLRCKLPMISYQGVWYCEQCFGQFYPREKAPEVEKIVDQMIKCSINSLYKSIWGRKHARKKSRNQKSGRRRKKPQKFNKKYLLPEQEF